MLPLKSILLAGFKFLNSPAKWRPSFEVIVGINVMSRLGAIFQKNGVVRVVPRAVDQPALGTRKPVFRSTVGSGWEK